MVSKMPLQSARMAAVATEYCTFVDAFNTCDAEVECFHNGLMKLEKLLPRLHVAVTALVEPTENVSNYRFYDDDQRCELFLRLNSVLQSDKKFWLRYESERLRQQSYHKLCERMADNLTDIYFDLKHGLELLQMKPMQATCHWQCSFYAHWGKHLLDAECWLHAVDAGGEPPRLPEWWWPNQSNFGFSLV